MNGPSSVFRGRIGIFALLLAAVSPARAMDGVVTVMPLSGLSAGEVRQCGIRATSGSDAGQLTVDIALERAGKATDLVVRAAGRVLTPPMSRKSISCRAR